MVGPPIVHPRRPERDRPGSQIDCPFVVRLPVAHHHRVPLFVSQVAQSLDVLLDFQLQGCQDHPTSSFPGQLVQRLLDLGSLSFSVIRDKLEHGVSFRRFLDRLYGYLFHPKDTPLFS
jgi:hypothetical protein